VFLHHDNAIIHQSFGTGVSDQERYYYTSTTSLISRSIPSQLLPVPKNESLFEGMQVLVSRRGERRYDNSTLKEVIGKGLQKCI
jgi:hypothetical protein